MSKLIENIKNEVRSVNWANKKGAEFQYDLQKNQYRLIEITPDLKTFMVGRFHRNDNNCPVIAKGFIAYLIRNWGKKEVEIYSSYYASCFANFERNESIKPGSFQRDLAKEFYPVHVAQEKEALAFSNQLKPYINKPEIILINQYVKSYFDYINQVNTPIVTSDKTPTNLTENQLSVRDWCIIFYYLDEAGEKKGKKITRIQRFIEEHNVKNPLSKLTTKSHFKKEYYEIENRINIKNDRNPLPPERIEKILPYLKNNKRAMQSAENDIDYLLNEIEKNKDNDY